jgi:hypothetical protein
MEILMGQCPKRRILLTLIPLILMINGFGQQLKISFKLIDEMDKNPSETVFLVNIYNGKYDNYWIQDTAYLKNQVEYPETNLIYPFLWKKSGKIFKLYENYKHRPGTLVLKCVDSCCNCILIKQGQKLAFTLKLLECYNLTKGQYRMQVAIHPPIFSPVPKEQLGEIQSNIIKFSID